MKLNDEKNIMKTIEISPVLFSFFMVNSQIYLNCFLPVS